MLGWIYIALMIALAIASIRKPYFALVALLCMFGLEQWGMLYLAFVRNNAVFTNAAIFAILVVAIIVKPPPIRFNFKNFKARGLSILLILYAFISQFWAPADANTIHHWMAAGPYILANIFLAPLVVRSNDDVLKAYTWFVWIGGFLLLLFAFVPHWEGRHLIISGNYNHGLKIDLPLTLAQFSGYVLIAALLNYRPTLFSTAVTGIAFTAVVVVMFKSGGRGAFIFSIFTILLMVPLVWRKEIAKKILPIGMFTLVIFAVLNGLLGESGDLSGRWSYNRLDSDFLGRLHNASFLIAASFETPVGILFGLGNTAAFSPRLLGIYPHIVPLEVLAEEGFIGFGLLIWFSLKTFSIGLRSLKTRRLLRIEKQVLAITFSCWLFTMFLSLKQGSLLTSPEIFLFAAILEKLHMITQRNISWRTSNEIV